MNLDSGRKLRLNDVLVSSAIVMVASTILLPVAFGSSSVQGQRNQIESRMHQLAVGIQAYAADNSEQLPFGSGFDSATNAWRWTATVQVPAGWRRSTTEVRNREDSLAWANSVQPYFKDWSLLESPDLPKFKVGDKSDYNNPKFPWKNVSFAYNGNLHSLSMSAVASPSKLTLLWHGYGRASKEGAAMASPMLSCGDPSVTCRYASGKQPSDMLFQPEASMWVYGKEAYFVSVDGTVTTRKLRVEDHRSGE